MIHNQQGGRKRGSLTHPPSPHLSLTQGLGPIWDSTSNFSPHIDGPSNGVLEESGKAQMGEEDGARMTIGTGGMEGQ